MLMDGDNCKSFLRTNKSHLLYMWQVFDGSQILHHTLSKLSNSVCANSNRIPDAAEGMSNKNKKEQEHWQSQQKFQTSVAASFAQMS